MRISVYITSYNQRKVLQEAIESVLAQTRPADEILVVDDASSDGSQDLIRGYAARFPSRVRPVLRQSNGGVASVRNEAVRAATGDFVTYVDGDDRFLPCKLAREEAALARQPGAELAFSDYYNITEQGDRTSRWAEGEPVPQGDVFAAVFARRFPRRDIFRFELVRRQRVLDAGGYDESLRIFEDFDFKIRVSRLCRACYVPEPLAERRVHALGLSAAPAEDLFRVPARIWEKNRALLKGLGPEEARRVRADLGAWLAPGARAAGHAALNAAGRPALERRLLALRRFLFCARYAPDAVSLGDLYALLLPARTAERLVGDARR